MIWVKSVTCWVSFGVEQVYTIIIDEVFDFSDLAVDGNVKLILIPFTVHKLVSILTNLDFPAFTISELSLELDRLFSLDESLADRNIVGMWSAWNISEVEKFIRERTRSALAMISNNSCANQIVRITMCLFFQKLVDVFRNVTSVVITFSEDRICDNSF